MESASWELALKPSLYNNRPKHSKYFCAGNTRLPRTSNLTRKRPLPAHLVSHPGKTPTFRAPQSRPKSTPTSTTGFREPPYKPTSRPGVRKLPTRQSMSSRWSPYHFILCTQLGRVSLSGYEVQSYFNILKYFDTIITN